MESGMPGGTRSKMRRQVLTHSLILDWANRHFAACDCWPTVRSGAVCGQPGETWCGVDVALRHGRRGLPGGDSLCRLLSAHPAARHLNSLPPLRVEDVLNWADAFHARRGRWPTTACGSVCGSSGETWLGIDRALREKSRITCPYLSLRRLLEVERGARFQQKVWALSAELILAWADGHFDRTGKWPVIRSGPIHDAAGLSWGTVDSALRYGRHGLPGGSSLSRLIRQSRPIRRTGLPMPMLPTGGTNQRVGIWHPHADRRSSSATLHTDRG
jgi:hypothetical protein